MLIPLVVLNVLVNGKIVNALYDPGANISVITQKLVDDLGIKINRNLYSSTFDTLSGTGKLKGTTNVKIKIFKMEKSSRLFVINDNKKKNYEIILGLDLIKSFRLCQDENLKIFQAAEKPIKNQNNTETQINPQINSYEIINSKTIDDK